MSGDMYEGGVADDRAVVGTISCYVNDNINNIPTESTLSVGWKRKKGNYIRVDTTTKNNKNYFNQQLKQLNSTTLRSQQHSSRSGLLFKRQ